MRIYKNKIVVVGAGMVGSAVVDTLLTLDLIAEIVVIDKNADKALGETLDASHTTSFTYSPNVNVRTGDYKDCSDAQIIIMTAGPSAKPGEVTDRLKLAATNINVMEDVMNSITKYTKEAVIIVVTNPVDVVTYFAQHNFNYPKQKIIGTGTMLDTARFRRILAKRYLVDTKNVHGYILGEHGESAFATWSLVNIGGIPVEHLDEFFVNEDIINTPLKRESVIEEVKSVGTEILLKKGFTSAGIAASVGRLTQAILLNELSLIPVSTTLNGEYGISDVSLSVPCVITSEGIGKVLEIPLTDEEKYLLHASADKLKGVIKKVLNN